MEWQTGGAAKYDNSAGLSVHSEFCSAVWLFEAFLVVSLWFPQLLRVCQQWRSDIIHHIIDFL